MKTARTLCTLLSAGILLGTQALSGSPIREQNIPEDVDWFIHLDADLLRQTRSGSTLLEQLRGIEQLQQSGKLPIQPVKIIDGLRGISMFGTMPDFANGEGTDLDGVVIIEGTTDLIQVVRGLVAGIQLEQPEALGSTAVGDLNVLTMKDAGVHGVFIDDSRIALGKSMASLEEFLAVRGGAKPHLSIVGRFPTYQLGTDSGVFFGAFVEGVGAFKQLPAQARILQMTRAVAVQLGETGDNLNLLASLVTDSDQTGQQVQEVLRGLIALLMITQNGNPDVAAIVQSAGVGRDGSTVSLRLSYPVASVHQWAKVLEQTIRSSMAASSADEAAAREAEADAGADAEVTAEPGS